MAYTVEPTLRRTRTCWANARKETKIKIDHCWERKYLDQSKQEFL